MQKISLTSLLFLLGIGLTACGSTLWPSEEELNNQNIPELINPNQVGISPAQQLNNTENQADGSSNSKPSNQVQIPNASKPILTIYFESGDTAYQRSLFKIVEAVLPHKSNAIFRLMLVSPDDSLAEIERIHAYGAKVSTSLKDMGVPEDQIQQFQMVLPIPYPQIMLYVE